MGKRNKTNITHQNHGSYVSNDRVRSRTEARQKKQREPNCHRKNVRNFNDRIKSRTEAQQKKQREPNCCRKNGRNFDDRVKSRTKAQQKKQREPHRRRKNGSNFEERVRPQAQAQQQSLRVSLCSKEEPNRSATLHIARHLQRRHDLQTTEKHVR